MKEIKDLIAYLKHIDKLAKPLKPAQKKELRKILAAVLTLLVSLKRDSGLGKFTFSWED